MDYIELNKKNTKLLIDQTDEKVLVKLKKNRYDIQLNMFGLYMSKDEPVLDIGVRDGAFLQILKDMGCTDLYGIDIFEESIELLKQRGIDGCVADAQEFKLDKLFDTVIMSHVLEHCPEPKKVLDNVYNHTRDHAIIFIEVPIEEGDPKPTEKDAHYFNFHSFDDMLKLLGKDWEVLEKFVSEKRIKVVARRITHAE
jgi:2-polyprenyl-3-methyl-5-hydroxy-6-metoxy-1,4-benzoquinol methylase